MYRSEVAKVYRSGQVQFPPTHKYGVCTVLALPSHWTLRYLMLNM
jgi:hypothetical protein